MHVKKCNCIGNDPNWLIVQIIKLGMYNLFEGNPFWIEFLNPLAIRMVVLVKDGGYVI